MAPKSFPLKKMIDQYENGVYYDEAQPNDLLLTFQYFIDHREKLIEHKNKTRYAYEVEFNPDRQREILLSFLTKLNL
jgi:uncharacterized protein (DUF934 family)